MGGVGREGWEVMLEGVVLERVKCFKYLGVWIQEDGRWGEMARNREEQGRSRLARLRGQWKVVKYSLWMTGEKSGKRWGE